MDLDPGAARLLAVMGAGRPTDWTRVNVAERRRGFADLMRWAGRPPDLAGVDSIEVAGAARPLAARLYRPRAEPAGPRPALVYLHGGGLVAGSLDTHDALCRSLSAGSRCRVLAVAYRLAPENPFPAAIDDVTAAWGDVLGRAPSFGLDPSRIGIGGDSGGATLAVVTCLALKRRPDRRPALQLLLCPVLDAAPDTASRRAFARGYLLDGAMMDRDLLDYAPGSVDLADPRLSPLRAPDVSGLPRTLIHTAEFDPLRDEGALFARRLADAGVAVDLRCHGGMIHHFYGLTGLIPAANRLLEGIARQIGDALSETRLA